VKNAPASDAPSTASGNGRNASRRAVRPLQCGHYFNPSAAQAHNIAHSPGSAPRSYKTSRWSEPHWIWFTPTKNRRAILAMNRGNHHTRAQEPLTTSHQRRTCQRPPRLSASSVAAAPSALETWATPTPTSRRTPSRFKNWPIANGTSPTWISSDRQRQPHSKALSPSSGAVAPAANAAHAHCHPVDADGVNYHASIGTARGSAAQPKRVAVPNDW